LDCSTGRSAINIVDDILENAEEYDFYQAVRLLERLSDSAEQDASKGLKIRPDLNLDYPHADIESITETDDGFEIITTFFGLYGVSSPLPGYITDELLDEEWEERHATREFLDVVHQHIYPLLYRAWLKYRFSHNAIEGDGERYWEIIFSILGLPEEFREFGDLSGQFLKYSGLIAQRPKSQLGLKALLDDYMGDIDVDVIPCVPRNVKIIEQQRCFLGDKCNTLGHQSVIGEQVVDRSGKYRVVIGPIDTDQFRMLLDDRKHMKFIRTIIELYMVQPLECEVVLQLKKGAARPAGLGQAGFSSLGQSCWLVHENHEFEFTVVLQ